jgi:hypothetical protein
MRRSLIGLVLVLPLAVTCGKDDDDDGGGSSSGGGTTGDGGTQTDTSDSSSGGSDTSSGGSGTTSSSSGSGSESGSGTTGLCGNNTIDPGEDCDGTELGGETCESLGEGTGTLGCDPMTCTYDTSMCTGNGSSTSGG